MTGFSDLLSLGDLRSDGLADEVARLVIDRVDLLTDLVDALASPDPSIRGHAADALEKVARVHPEPCIEHLPLLARRAVRDPVPMVRWHMAMTLGHLSVIPATASRLLPVLRSLVRDDSPFVRSWAVSALTIAARRSPRSAPAALRAIAPLVSDPSPAVAKRAQTALRALSDPAVRLPKSWDKSAAR